MFCFYECDYSRYLIGLPCDSVGKESACNAGDRLQCRRPGFERSPGEGHGNPLQYSCLGNPLDRRAWWAAVHGVTRVRRDLATKPRQLPPGTSQVELCSICLLVTGSSSISVMFSRSIYIVMCVRISSFSPKLNNIWFYVYTTFCLIIHCWILGLRLPCGFRD